MTDNFLNSFDFSVLDSTDFKEDAVREDIVRPILNELGYSASSGNRIIRGKILPHPFVNLGSRKHRITMIPDYILQVQNRNAWVLDAKAPTELIKSGRNVEQAYSYAMHPDIRAKRYALCNGHEFIAFSVEESIPILHFPIPQINSFWSELKWLLAPQAFQKTEKPPDTISSTIDPKTEQDYTIEKEIGVLWSNYLNVEEYAEIVRFKGQLLAKTKTEDANGPRWYELYRLRNGCYVVFMSYNHRGDWGGATLRGVNAWNEVDPPLTLKEVQNEYPALAKVAGLVPVREFNPDGT